MNNESSAQSLDGNYKKRYTIGALFTPELDCVVLIEKTKPDWQKGKLNLPGGHIEPGETSAECMRREFKEECGVDIDNWLHVGRIDNAGNYYVDVFAAICPDSQPIPLRTMTEEAVDWYEVYDLPAKCISNLFWIVPFAANVLQQGNHDFLTFGKFSYEYR
jgi:8-oxo-dGTP diphosphatase